MRFSSNNLKQNQMTAKRIDNRPNYRQQILIEYLQAYTPASPGDENIIYKSSQDIADELAEMVCLDTDEVSEKLVEMGFHTGLNAAGELRWMLNTP